MSGLSLDLELVKEWIEESLGEKYNDLESFSEALKSGVVLCRTINQCRPGTIKRINHPSSPLACKENIGAFLRACKLVGLSDYELFEISDLYDERNVIQVTSSILKLRKLLLENPAEGSEQTSPLPSTSPVALPRESPLVALRQGPPPVPDRKKKPKPLPIEDPVDKEDSGSDEEVPKKDKDKDKSKIYYTIDRIFGRKKNATHGSGPVPIPTSNALPSTSPPSSLSPHASSLVPDDERNEITKMKIELSQLYSDRKVLKERVAFAYPEKYRTFVMFDDLLKKDDTPNFTPAEGQGEYDFFKLEGTKVLREIFTLTCILAVVEENRSLRIRLEELQKMVDAMCTEKKSLMARVDELLASQSLSSEPQDMEEEGITFSDYKGKTEIKGGTTEKLVERLYSKNVAGSVSEYIDTFLLTYRSFTTPKKVLETLTRKYNENRVAEEDNADSNSMQVEHEKLTKKKLRLRICNFLKRWVDSYFEDFDEDLINAFHQYIAACPVDDQLVTLLKRSLDRKLAGRGVVSHLTFDRPAPASILPRQISGVGMSLDDINTSEMARQLTYIEYDLYRAITPKELLSLSWQKSDRDVRSPNLLKMIQRFNDVNNFVVWHIVREPVLKRRAVVLKKFIKLAEELKKLNNFNAVFVLVSALRSASVNRLKKTWEEISKFHLKQFEEFDVLTSPNGSFSNYREDLHNANPPCIPYMGVYLSDLTFIEEGNPDYLENSYVNFFKCRMVAEVIKEIQQYQQKPYNLTPVPAISQFLTSHKSVSDNECFKLSLIAEPRETTSG